MERLVDWKLQEKDFALIKETLKTNTMDMDYMGTVNIGHLSVDIIFRDYDNKLLLDYDVFVGGIDRGYSYTVKGDLPYDLADGGTFDSEAIKSIETVEEFKDYAMQVIEEYITSSSYEVDGIKLIDKANAKEFFNWE